MKKLFFILIPFISSKSFAQVEFHYGGEVSFTYFDFPLEKVTHFRESAGADFEMKFAGKRPLNRIGFKTGLMYWRGGVAGRVDGESYLYYCQNCYFLKYSESKAQDIYIPLFLKFYFHPEDSLRFFVSTGLFAMGITRYNGQYIFPEPVPGQLNVPELNKWRSWEFGGGFDLKRWSIGMMMKRKKLYLQPEIYIAYSELFMHPEYGLVLSVLR